MSKPSSVWLYFCHVLGYIPAIIAKIFKKAFQIGSIFQLINKAGWLNVFTDFHLLCVHSFKHIEPRWIFMFLVYMYDISTQLDNL